jgi:predicted nucleotidyltransferase
LSSLISENELKIIIDKVVAHYNPDKIVLFGSYAKGNPHDDSDLDLLIIKDTSLSRHARGRDVKGLFYGSMVPIDFVFCTNQEVEDSKHAIFSFVDRVLAMGKVLYEKNITKNTH